MTDATELRWPEAGERFTDAIGRTLVVSRVRPKDRLGREIVGQVNGRDYATDYNTFDAIWRRQLPPWSGS